mmetsp:Transcript_16388/g.20023  ORF Transcript_16388/g.20023 Transcript_16388/m.20023 type:complete len:397 (+) Transcript_16388:112-1302(+)
MATTASFQRCSSTISHRASRYITTKQAIIPPSYSSNLHLRLYSTSRPLKYSLDNSSSPGGGDGSGLHELSRWPLTKTNTILNIVPQGKQYVVERLGRLHSIEPSGFFFGIPLIDRIGYVIDTRERAIDILPQGAITRDNVSVEVSGNLFVQFVDAEKAAYGARNPLYSVVQHSQSAMRAAIGEMELDEILHGRAKLNSLIKGALQEAAVAWGMEVKRYELTEITPDEEIRSAMDKQAAAERAKREQVLRAEGDKRRAELTSEGVKIGLKNESEGMLIKITNEAEAAKIKSMREAEGESEAMRLKAHAQADAIATIATQLQKEGGTEAAKLALAHNYVEMYGEMGSKSNTMFFNQNAGDVTSLLVQAAAAVNTASSNNKAIDTTSVSKVESIESKNQ